MVLGALGIVVGGILGIVYGGRFAHIGRRKIRAWGALPLAAACFAIPELLDNVHGAGTMHALGFSSVAMFCLANLNLVGVAVVLTGIALNLVPLAFNGVMPVSQAAAVTVDLGDFDEFDDVDLGAGRAVESSTQRFVFLGDTIPIAPLKQAVSFGDLILAFGLANIAFRLLKPRRIRFKDEHDGWPASTVPTEDISSDPWTAMLRGEIDESSFERQTAPQNRLPEPEWLQEPPVSTGTMLLSNIDPMRTTVPEPALPKAEALDLSLTWASPELTDEQADDSEAFGHRSPFAPPDEAPATPADEGPSKPLFDQDESHKNMESSGRSFAPELPDMNEPTPHLSDFERALTSFDADRRDYQRQNRAAPDQSPEVSAPEFTTGPIQFDEKPDDPRG